MTVPYAFANLSGNIALAKLDSNFNTPITIGNTSVLLGNTVTTLNNLTLANVTITSGTGTNISLTSPLAVSSGGTGIANLTVNNVLIGNGTNAITSVAPGTTGNVLTSIGGAWVSNVAVTSAAAGANTQVQYNSANLLAGSANLTFDGTNLGLAGGTANGVAYLNGSKVLTTGSALTFDGTNLGIGTSSPAAKLNAVGDNVPARGQLSLQTSTAVNFAQLTFYDRTTLGAQIFQGYQATAGVGDLTIQTAAASSALVFGTNSTERMRLDSSGNLGLGVTPSAWVNRKAIESTYGGALSFDSVYLQTALSSNCYYNGTNWIYKLSTWGATRYETGDVSNGSPFHKWYTAPSGTAGNAITFTQAMTLDASGNLGIGTSSPGEKLQVVGTGATTVEVKAALNTAAALKLSSAGGIQAGIFMAAPTVDSSLGFQTTGTERMRIDSSGNLLVGTTTNSETSRARIMNVNSSEWGFPTLLLSDSSGTKTFSIYNGAVGYNAAQTVGQIAKNSTTSRSLNAAGTVNASGADYAEYMTKAGDFAISKGDICGIDARGKLTNVFADAVSFVVKSTDPSYVGGDSWG